MPAIQTIAPCLWFNGNGEAAARFYTSIFPNSRIVGRSHYGEAGPMPKGTVLVVDFELAGQRFMALNGGPQFQFTEAISMMVRCDTQQEIDRYWEKLSEGGETRVCGWLKDKFGLSWQVVPSMLNELLTGQDQEKANRVMAAVMRMQKLDIEEMKRAAEAA